jgi:hypothetical protein
MTKPSMESTMWRETLSSSLRQGRQLAPLVLLVGGFLGVAAWAFAFSPAGTDLVYIGSALIVAGLLLRPTPRMVLVGLVLLFLVWRGVIFIFRGLSAF